MKRPHPQLLSRRKLKQDNSAFASPFKGGSTVPGDHGSSFPMLKLHRSSVLVWTQSQLVAASVLRKINGSATRIVLFPPDSPQSQLAQVVKDAEVDYLVSDTAVSGAGTPTLLTADLPLSASTSTWAVDSLAKRTEWVLLTSGTTGFPKLVLHTFSSLTNPINNATTVTTPVWSTFYDIRRYGGLQVLLRAALSRAKVVLQEPQEELRAFLIRVSSEGVTHMSGTPSHWRKALMCPESRQMRLEYVRLSGEIADQGIIDALRACYPSAKLSHAFASTEAGLAFEVNDGLAGFPASMLSETEGVEMKVVNDTLRIRSNRNACRYLGVGPALKDENGFIDSGDILELRGNRYYFVGRRDGLINVGGMKVHSEEIEAVLNEHPQVHMSMVRSRKSPITGALVIADIVVNSRDSVASQSNLSLEQDILLYCKKRLPAFKIPTSIRFVPSLRMSEAGKLDRSYA